MTFTDFRSLKVSTILDIVTEYINEMDEAEENSKKKEKKEEVRKATQADIDALFHRTR